MDYADLLPDAARLARVNACLQQTTPEDAVHSWRFFCDWYLRSKPGFDPMFYRNWLDFGPLHYQLIQSWERDPSSAWACPRGSGKSTTVRSYLLWKLCTHVQLEINFIKLKDDFVIEDVQRIREQLEENTRIVDDFGLLAPGKGKGIWTNHHLQTTTKCWLRGVGVEGGKRGWRGDINVCDDMEKDPKKVTPTESVRAGLIELILKVMEPTMDLGGRMMVVGTNPHAQSFLGYVVTQGEEESEIDPRFSDKLWFKALVDVEDADGRNCWPAKFTRSFLDNKRERMGDAWYGSEYMNRPGSDQDRPLKIVPSKHEYVITGELDERDPWNSNATIIWNDCLGTLKAPVLEPRQSNYREWLGTLYRLITVDYAYTVGAGSDFSCIHVIGVDALSTWHSLDLWLGKLPFPALINMIWHMAALWRVNVVGAEAFPVQEGWFAQITERGEELRERAGFVPACVPIVPSVKLEKGSRILRLQSRFERGRIKLPAHRRLCSPYKDLYSQIASFTEDLQSLRNDDALDTLSLAHDLLRGARPAPVGGTAPQTNIEQMLAGQTHLEGTDIPIALAINWRGLDEQTTSRLLSSARERRMADFEQAEERRALAAEPPADWYDEPAEL